MFSEETLLEIFKDKEARKVPFIYQTVMIHAIERVLENTDKSCDSKEEN